jgi:hypothetical protein
MNIAAGVKTPSILLLFAMVLTPVAAASPAWSKGCGSSKLKAATSALSKLKNWAELHAYFTDFAACDDGGAADELTEKVVRLLVDRWDDTNILASEAQNDPKFLKFVVLHIDSTADTDDLDKIRANAAKHCPASLDALCKQIGSAARNALK